MNKTVNINLAGIFFHIDEDAYQKLQRYLEAIKRSFRDPQGRNEIIADIEARISELFNERVENDKQVVSMKELDEVIAIMGQPEDYMVDEEIFNDEPERQYRSKRSNDSRKLFRDTENAYIGGVSSGLGHYFNVDPLWIRIIWFILFFGAGTGVLLYIILWVLMPVAETTSDKLAMSGKPINITNIEEKVKEGFSNVKESLDHVSDRIANVDYESAGNNVKQKSRSFFDALGSVIMFFFKIFAKFFGIILMIVGATTLIALIVSLLSLGAVDIINFPGLDIADVFYSSNLPIWIVALLLLFAVGIPFFFIFILGLKILVNNLKSIGRTAGFTLFGLWLAAIVTLAIFAAKEAAEFARHGDYTQKIETNIVANDTLFIDMINNDMYSDDRYHHNEYEVVHDENGNQHIYSGNIRFSVKSTNEAQGYLKVEKNSRGSSYQVARDRAEQIKYNVNITDGKLSLDNYFLTDAKNKFRGQSVRLTLYMPEGSILYANKSIKKYRRWSATNDLLRHKKVGHYLKIKNGDTECLDCEEDKNFKVSVDVKGNNSKVKYNEDEGLEVKQGTTELKVNDGKVISETESTKTTIDSSGISIKTKDN